MPRGGDSWRREDGEETAGTIASARVVDDVPRWRGVEIDNYPVFAVGKLVCGKVDDNLLSRW